MRIAPEAVLFDHDGLLVETEMLFFEVIRGVLSEFGLTISPEYWGEEYLGKGRSSTSVVRDIGLPDAQLERFAEVRNARYQAALERPLPLCPYAMEMLLELKRCHTIGLVTGNSRRAIETVHRFSNFLNIFDLIVTSEDFERPKPYPDSYRCALGRLSIPPERCVAVEDSRRGMEAALAAGMACVVVPGTLTRGHKFPGALAVLPSLQKVPSVIMAGMT